jgi:aminomuconate-semialdehyde/2-hydroxymuconate-6-semialdehyde dehydrogenase
MLNLIDGERVPAASGAWLDVVEPATGRVHGGVARSGGDDVQRAVAAAERAFPAWAATPAEERSRLMLAVAARIEERLDELAAAESLDNGKPVALARRVDIPRAAANMRFFATAILHGHSELYESRGRALNVTLRQPHGVVGLISPWNLPLYLLTWKIAPAIAAGNTAVAKPSEITPLTADLLAEILQKTGLPPGVVNIVHGTGPEVGAPLVEHASVRAVSFTGSTRTGAEIARRTAGSFTKLSLEMGGKNPTLIFADADLERALPEAARAAFANQGQICLCGSRVIAEESVYERVLEALTRAAGALRVGDPRDEATEQGAVVSEAHRDKVLAAIERARAEGGRVVTG